MKIAVIGSGNAGIISTIMSLYIHRSYNTKDPEITVFHDPNTPTEIVGQGTTIDVSRAIHKILKVDEKFNNKVGITPKVGFLYKNWARKDKNLLYKLGGNGMSYHYDPKLLREHFLKSNIAKFVEKKVSPEDIEVEFDFVFDCRGKSCNDWENYDVLESPVNSCLLGRIEGNRAHEVWTENIATPDGWCFKIPLSNGHSYGYVFNSEITSSEEARKNFKELLGVDTVDEISFKNYLAKNFFYKNSKKTILNGNRLFFLEPLESTATPMYGVTATTAINMMYIPDPKYYVINLRSRLKEVHEWILWHYYFGSHYDTKFWKYAKDLSRSYRYSEKFIERIKYVEKTCDYDRYVDQLHFPNEIEGEFAYTDYATWFFNNS